MSEAMHTPGPWSWDCDPVKGDPFDRVRYQVVAKGKTITKTYYSSYEGGPTNAEADTRLIAAAPDLLEALQMLLDDIQDYQRINNLGGEQNHSQVKARAAIARATGKGE